MPWAVPLCTVVLLITSAHVLCAQARSSHLATAYESPQVNHTFQMGNFASCPFKKGIFHSTMLNVSTLSLVTIRKSSFTETFWKEVMTTQLQEM